MCLLDPVNAVFRPMVVLIVNIAPDVMICVICRNGETYFMNRMLICQPDIEKPLPLGNACRGGFVYGCTIYRCSCLEIIVI